MTTDDNQTNFQNGTMAHLAALLLTTPPIHIGEWQSKNTADIPQMATYEALDVTFGIDQVPANALEWATTLGDDLNLAWAEEHFMERVGGVPVNPPPSHQRWPWARYNGNHQNQTMQFSHTYPERMWPKYAGLGNTPVPPVFDGNLHTGIRYAYGDLNDLVALLRRSPMTRQAYLPIWFPEDTGAVHRERVPCTLGYHFLIRGGELSCRYYMRSCDLIRHFTDDVYLAGRLMQWVVERLNLCINPWHYSAPARTQDKMDCPECPSLIRPGRLAMYISSLHAFVGDSYKLNTMMERANARTAG